MSWLTRWVALTFIGLMPLSAVAHHSAVVFDQVKLVLVKGTVTQYVWANPHVWIFMAVPDGKGGTETWQIEGAALITLARQGWTSTTLRPGDRLSLVVAPRKDGTYGGRMLRAIFEDGHTLD